MQISDFMKAKKTFTELHKHHVYFLTYYCSLATVELFQKQKQLGTTCQHVEKICVV